jgi:hypothetical protein
MQALSYPNHVVPKLSVDDVTFAEATVAKINRAQIARPGTFIAKTYWDVVETLADMLDILETRSPDIQDRDRRHRSVLRLSEILMLRCTSLSDYLGQLLIACASSSVDDELKQCRQAIAERLGRNVRVPINKTKHDGFTLAPIVLTNGMASVPGFVVYGPLQDGLSGPLSFSRKHGAGTPEGFSLPLFMRQVLANIFAMTDIARERLTSWGSIDTSQDAALAQNPNVERVASLSGVLDRLNAQPFYGFEGEHTTRSPKFLIAEGTLCMQLAQTKRLRGRVIVNFQVPSVHAGAKFQMPYWKGSR